MRILPRLLFLFALALPAPADVVVLKSGERFVGEVKDEGDTVRIRNERFPDGVVVKKSDVKAVYPKVEELLARLDAGIGKARAKYEAGKAGADPNAEMKAVVDLLFDPELEATEGAEIYPDRKKDFDERVTAIHDLRKMARDAQTLGGPPVEPKKDPNPVPKPGAQPQPAPEPASADFKERPTVWLSGAQGASQADLEKAAKAMASRCEAFGVKGVKARVEAGADGLARVRLDVDGGFDAPTVRSIATIGRFAGKTFEMRLYYYATGPATESFEIPNDDQIAGAKAPAGTKWLKRVRFNADGADAPRPASLMRMSPVISRAELMPPEKDKPDSAADFYVISEAAEARLKAALRSGGTFKCEIAVDDVLLVSDLPPSPKDHPKDGRVWWRHSFSEKERKIADGYRLHPMPFPMRVVEAPK